MKRGCVYGLYRDEADTLRDEVGYLDYIYQCKGCLNCVQNCTKNILTRVVNPEYLRLGDSYYTPDIILSTWYQAETGRIPVSGSGYGGPFSGPGFDSMWTDMSEIVRPTRDGIHGREYISTSVDIGRKLPHLSFAGGQLNVDPPPLVEMPLPVIFDRIPRHWNRGAVMAAIATAAAEIGTLAVLSEADVRENEASVRGQVVPLLATPPAVAAEPGAVGTVRDDPGQPGRDGGAGGAEAGVPAKIVAIRVAASPAVAGRVADLTRDGAEVIHLVFDSHGREQGPAQPRHMRDVLRDMHTTLGQAGHPGPGHADRLGRNRAGRARGQGDHLRRRPGGDRHPPDAGPGMPAVRGMPTRASPARSPWRRSTPGSASSAS